MIRIRIFIAATLFLASASFAAQVQTADYRGWKSLQMENGLITINIVPDIGGRVIQLRLGDFQFLWVNPQLAGKLPPKTGLGKDGAWLNYGGDKLWPAPQGWDNDQQWPGPPDAILDGSPHAAQVLAPQGTEVAVGLTSQDDPRSGIRFSRTIRIFDGGSRVSFDSTMTNIDSRPRRWSIWQVTQVNAAEDGGKGYNPEIRCYSPLNPNSRYPRGYLEMFGLVNNPSFDVDWKNGLVIAHYQRIVGKIGIDNSAGWAAVVDGKNGYALVERFTHYPGRKYPDNTSVQFWMNGVGQIVAGKKISESRDDPIETPPLVESEILSPMAELKPGESYSFHLDWFATRIGGNYPILDCTEIGVTCERLMAKPDSSGARLTGRFGTFYPGRLELVYPNDQGKTSSAIDLGNASPLKPITIDKRLAIPRGTTAIVLILRDSHGNVLGELARTRLAPN